MDYEKLEFETRIDLNTFANGTLKGHMEDAFASVFANILDDGTSEKAHRRILVTLDITPSEGRESATVEVTVKTKLAPPAPGHTAVVFGRDREVSFLREDSSQQLELVDSEEE